MSVKFGDSNIGAEIGTPTLNANITRPSINVNFNAPALGASGGNTILRELVNPQFFIGIVETLDAGEDVYCYLTGTKDEPVLNFGIPKGYDGVSPAVTVGTITGGHSVKITDADHPTGQTFNVMDGVDGQDGQDGQDGVGVPSGGTTGQVLKKTSATDYDTEWGAVEAVPTGGTTGQVLAKKTDTDYDIEWIDPPDGTVTDVTVNGTSVVTSGVAQVVVPEPAPTSGATPSTDTQYGSVGTSTQYARKDHRHTSNFPTTGTPADLGTAANGTSATYAHADHVHNYPEVVHVGASAPSDSNIQVWLDTDEAGMSAVSSVNAKTGTVVLDADDVGGMSKWVLLWENANPTSNFAAQTIPLDMSGYDFFALYTKYRSVASSTDYNTLNICACIEGYNWLIYASSFGSINGGRRVVYAPNGIEFGAGYNNSSVANEYCIPLKIYGIKGAISA